MRIKPDENGTISVQALSDAVDAADGGPIQLEVDGKALVVMSSDRFAEHLDAEQTFEPLAGEDIFDDMEED